MQFNDTQLDTVQQFLQAGNLLAYPTEAVWGIGCDPFNETAVKQILAIKQRPIEKRHDCDHRRYCAYSAIFTAVTTAGSR